MKIGRKPKIGQTDPLSGQTHLGQTFNFGNRPCYLMKITSTLGQKKVNGANC